MIWIYCEIQVCFNWKWNYYAVSYFSKLSILLNFSLSILSETSKLLFIFLFLLESFQNKFLYLTNISDIPGKLGDFPPASILWVVLRWWVITYYWFFLEGHMVLGLNLRPCTHKASVPAQTPSSVTLFFITNGLVFNFNSSAIWTFCWTFLGKMFFSKSSRENR